MLTLASIGARAQAPVAEEVLRVKPSSATVQVWFNRIEKEGHIVLSYNPALIRMDDVVTIRRGGTVTIGRLLSKILHGYPYKLVNMPGRKLLIQVKTGAANGDGDATTAQDQQPEVGLTGIVSEAGSNEKLLGATIILTDEGGQRHYAVTGPDGSFYITTPPGLCRLDVHYMGYAPYTKTIDLKGNRHVGVALSPISFAIKAVTVERRKSMEELDEVAPSNMVAFSHSDLFSQIKILPGVSAMSANMDIHAAGGSSDENLYLLEGFPVYNPGHINSMFSPFNGDVLKSVSFYNGFIPTQYEGRLSSVIDSRLRDGNKENYVNTLSLDMPAASAVFEGPIIKNKLSYIIGGRRSWLDFLDKYLSEEDRMNHNAHDFNVKLSLSLDSLTSVSLSAYNSTDNYHTSEEESKQSTLHWNNQLYALHFNTHITPTISNASSVALASHSTNANPHDFGFEDLDILRSRIKSIYINTQFTYTPGHLYTMRWGMKGAIEQYQISAFGKQLRNRWEPIQQLSLFYDNRVRITPRLYAQIGVNYLHYLPRHNRKFNSIQPRLSIKYAIDDDNLVYANFSRMEQFFHHVSITDVVTPFDFIMPSIEGFKPSTATHIEMGWKHYTAHGILELSAYYKKRQNLLALHPDINIEEINWNKWIMEGNGDSRGVSIYYYDRWKRWKWQASYTYSKSREWFDILKQRGKLPALYDVPHVLNGAVSYELGRSSQLTLGGNLHSGRIIEDDDYDSPDLFATFRTKRDPLRFRIDASYTFQKEFKKSKLLLRFGLYNIIGNPSEEEMLYYFSIKIRERRVPFGTISFKF